MKYTGKLYGDLGNRRYFDTGKTSEDWDKLESDKGELLEACKEALRHHQGGHSEIGHLLRKAIEKATNTETK